MKTFFAHLCHGASHLPLSGRFLRVFVLAFGMITALYALGSDHWLTVLAALAAVVTGLIATLELHEIATACDQVTDDEVGESGFGCAA